MVLCKFGHYSLVSKISQKLSELEPHNDEFIGSDEKMTRLTSE